MNRAVLLPLRNLLIVAAALAIWQAASDFGVLSPFLFPPPRRIAEAFFELAVAGFPDGVKLSQHLIVTVTRIVEGFLAAMVLAIPLGVAIGRSPTIDALTAPIVTFARSIATLSLLPLAIVWFGIGELSKVFLICYACFWVMLSNVIAAVKYIDPNLVSAARTMDVSGAALFFRVLLPAATPRILAGARVALGVGFMVIVGAEMIGTVRGLGALIMEARNFYRTDITLAGMVALGLIGFALTIGLSGLERWLLPWQNGLDDVRR